MSDRQTMPSVMAKAGISRIQCQSGLHSGLQGQPELHSETLSQKSQQTTPEYYTSILHIPILNEKYINILLQKPKTSKITTNIQENKIKIALRDFIACNDKINSGYQF